MRTILGVFSLAVPLGLAAIMLIEPFFWPRGSGVFDVMRIVLGVFGIILMFGYISHASRSRKVPSEKRGLWISVLLFGNILALPFFWFWYIQKPAEAAGNHAADD